MAKQWKKSLTGDDVQAEAEDALEKDISQMSPASNSVADNLDGGVAAVDWSSKTPTIREIDNWQNTSLTISGSGYLLGFYGNPSGAYKVSIDGSPITASDNSTYPDGALNNQTTTPVIARFETELELTDPAGSSGYTQFGYVLD
jgi:hypothetical protein